MADLNDIQKQVIDFANRLIELQQKSPAVCDLNLDIPAWKSKLLNYPERFVSSDVLGNIAKFSTHMKLLQDHESVLSEEINKEILNRVSAKLIDQAQLYAQKAITSDDKVFSTTLITLLENIKPALAAYSRPNAPHGPEV
jgi:hypothetical protein